MNSPPPPNPAILTHLVSGEVRWDLISLLNEHHDQELGSFSSLPSSSVFKTANISNVSPVTMSGMWSLFPIGNFNALL